MGSPRDTVFGLDIGNTKTLGSVYANSAAFKTACLVLQLRIRKIAVETHERRPPPFDTGRAILGDAADAVPCGNLILGNLLNTWWLALQPGDSRRGSSGGGGRQPGGSGDVFLAW